MAFVDGNGRECSQAAGYSGTGGETGKEGTGRGSGSASIYERASCLAYLSATLQVQHLLRSSKSIWDSFVRKLCSLSQRQDATKSCQMLLTLKDI